MSAFDAEYVLPLRRKDRSGEDELVEYLRWLQTRIDVTVVDGSDAALFGSLHERLPAGIRHISPRRPGINGKARGVQTGLDLARGERIVLADDDVRYDDSSLTEVVTRLDHADFVRPQNVYTAQPWHARWDTARMLIGRALGGDFGGTVAVRRSLVQRAGGYRTDVLFENLELERTVRAGDGRVDVAKDVFVARIPPTVAHFAGQRVRQAYDGFAQPARLIAELALGPLVVTLAVRGKWRALAACAIGAMTLAETGRRSAGGARAFPASSALWAPLWTAERAASVWVALFLRLRGGVPYSGERIVVAASSPRALRRRLDGRKDVTHV